MTTLDSQATLLLCSHLGLPSETEHVPYTLKDWNQLARKLNALSMRPGDLLGLSSQDIQHQLLISSQDSERISRLLERRGSMAIELERLRSSGIGVITRADSDYPERYRQRLKESAPTILFFAGELSLLGQPGIAVVGSRNLDEAGQDCTDFVGNACGLSGLVLYSGGARGVDTISMNAALNARGTAVGILADSLEKAIHNPDYRGALNRRDLCLVTPYSPNSPFSVGTAMGRNRLIYAIADFAIIVASDAHKGGTWAGASQAIQLQVLPVFVLAHPAMPEGNKLLISKGALPFPHPFPENYMKLKQWLGDHSEGFSPGAPQPSLF